MIKKFLGIFAVVLLLVVSVSSVYADNNEGKNSENDDRGRNELRLNWQKELTPKMCDAKGMPVINALERVNNDVDSGFGASVWWAIDNYTRHITVWSTGENSWCATVSYEGQFNAVEGQSAPGGTGVIGSNIKGVMLGGYRATFTGTLKATPLWPKYGLVGTVNYGCNISGQGSCTGLVSWTDQYFSGVGSFNQPWWGWIYYGGKHGTWVNAINVSPANSGNIL